MITWQKVRDVLWSSWRKKFRTSPQWFFCWYLISEWGRCVPPPCCVPWSAVVLTCCVSWSALVPPCCSLVYLGPPCCVPWSALISACCVPWSTLVSSCCVPWSAMAPAFCSLVRHMMVPAYCSLVYCGYHRHQTKLYVGSALMSAMYRQSTRWVDLLL